MTLHQLHNAEQVTLPPEQAEVVWFLNDAVLGYRVSGAKELVQPPDEDGTMVLSEAQIDPVLGCISEGLEIFEKAQKGYMCALGRLTTSERVMAPDHEERLRAAIDRETTRIALVWSVLGSILKVTDSPASGRKAA